MKTVTVEVPTLGCSGCDRDFNENETAYCQECADAYCAESASEAVAEKPSVTKELRDWVARRHLMGQISREVREQLELCADDIEAGHG